MNKNDIVFFDCYKQLDFVLSEALDCKNGVSEYISLLESSGKVGNDRIVTRDYKTLKHLRWIRNQIAHDVNEGNATVSTAEDKAALKEIYTRVKNRTAPLLTRGKKCKTKRKESGSWWLFLLLLGTGVLITALILVFILIIAK